MPNTRRRYAEDTTVPVERSRLELEQLLQRYGATAFGAMWEGDRQVVVFQIRDRRVLLDVPLPKRTERRFTHTESRGWPRSAAQAQLAYEQAVRARWRALVLVVKAKLEAVDAGITTIEREFLADIALPDGRTVGQFMAPQIDRAYRSGEMPALLPGSGDG